MTHSSSDDNTNGIGNFGIFPANYTIPEFGAWLWALLSLAGKL